MANNIWTPGTVGSNPAQQEQQRAAEAAARQTQANNERWAAERAAQNQPIQRNFTRLSLPDEPISFNYSHQQRASFEARPRTELYVRPRIKASMTPKRILLLSLVLGIFVFTQSSTFSRPQYFFLNWGGHTHYRISMPALNILR